MASNTSAPSTVLFHDIPTIHVFNNASKVKFIKPLLAEWFHAFREQFRTYNFVDPAQQYEANSLDELKLGYRKMCQAIDKKHKDYMKMNRDPNVSMSGGNTGNSWNNEGQRKVYLF